MGGTLYGIGVGPGDPELITIKALRMIKECDYIALPNKEKDSCASYGIVKEIYSEIEEKECIYLDCPMTKNNEILEMSHKKNIEKLAEVLKKDKNIAFLTLGDPSIYSTYQYLHTRICEMGYHAQMISGVPSFCAIAAKLGIALGEKEEEIHIIPATYGIDQIFQLSGTKILLKAGKKLEEIKKVVKEKKLYIAMVEKCGWEDEKIAIGLDNIGNEASYYTIVIIK